MSSDCTQRAIRSSFRGIQTGFDMLKQQDFFTIVKGFKGTVVNRTLLSLHVWSLEITLIVPLKLNLNMSIGDGFQFVTKFRVAWAYTEGG